MVLVQLYSYVLSHLTHYLLSDPLGPQCIDLTAVDEDSLTKVLTTVMRMWFRDSLIPRDVCCIFTSDPEVEAAHIMPFVKQDEVRGYILLTTFVDLLFSGCKSLLKCAHLTKGITTLQIS